MQLWTRRSWLSLPVVAVLGIILMLLAVLQYRWSGQVSEAERARMQYNLATSVNQLRNEFRFELRRICGAFQFDPADFPGRDWQRYAGRYGLLTTHSTRLVANIFIWDAEAGPASGLLQLNQAAGKFESVSWPPGLDSVRNGRFWTVPPQPAPGFRANTWVIIEQIPLLLLPLVHFPPPSSRSEQGPRTIGCLMIELNPGVLWGEFLPELAHRYFGGEQGFTYQIAIVNEAARDRVLYQSVPSLPPEFFSSPDSRVSLMPGPRDPPPRFGEEGPGAPPPENDSDRSGPGGSQTQFRSRGGGPRNQAVIVLAPDGNNWMLLARHNEGTLGQVVASQRRRNLAISFGILVLLGFSMAMIILSTRRAQKLARLQMDFVAGVSHELRTPLSVICSAGDNLAEGVVAASHEQVVQYGDLIRQEGRRLAAMVEQILMFARSQDGRKKYDLRLAQAGQIVESTLAKVQSAIGCAGFTVERQIEPGLPPIRVDETALSQCLENLINNALKYGGPERWMRISIASAPKGQGREIQITVEDRGMGIDKADLPHIFDPFYRGAAATAAQIHGSGLGLSLAREGIVAMGGRISVKSNPGAGSTFTIHLPAVVPVQQDHVLQDEAS